MYAVVTSQMHLCHRSTTMTARGSQCHGAYAGMSRLLLSTDALMARLTLSHRSLLSAANFANIQTSDIKLAI